MKKNTFIFRNWANWFPSQYWLDIGCTWFLHRVYCHRLWLASVLRQVEIQNKWLGIIQCTMQAHIIKFRVTKHIKAISKHKWFVRSYPSDKEDTLPDRCGGSNEGKNRRRQFAPSRRRRWWPTLSLASLSTTRAIWTTSHHEVWILSFHSRKLEKTSKSTENGKGMYRNV